MTNCLQQGEPRERHRGNPKTNRATPSKKLPTVLCAVCDRFFVRILPQAWHAARVADTGKLRVPPRLPTQVPTPSMISVCPHDAP
jgi:hypothetical protein